MSQAMTRPEGVTDVEWEHAVMRARQDPHRLRSLVSRGVVRRDSSSKALPLPAPPRNPTIRPNKKKRGKRR